MRHLHASFVKKIETISLSAAGVVRSHRQERLAMGTTALRAGPV